MPPFSSQLHITIIYFIYGLSFFTLGLAVFLESGRIPMLAGARTMRPLAAFGIIHGIHEWLELFLMPLETLGPLPHSFTFIRIFFLIISFASLFAYGIRALNWPNRPFAADVAAGMIILTLYFGLLFISGNVPRHNPATWSINADVLARYLVAVPGALLAAIALRSQYLHWRDSNPLLARCLIWAGGGFFFYGLSQLFVKNSDLTFCSYLTVDFFHETVGMPIQSLRSLVAAIIAVSLIKAIHIVEYERRQKLKNAEQQRLEALDRLQEELEKRKEMRRELLHRTVLAQEEERKRISRELHDETAQVLTATSLNMSTLKQIIPDTPEAHEIISRSQELCRTMARGLHRLVHDLRPAQLDDLGLEPSLRFLADDARRNTGLIIKFETVGDTPRIDSLIETVLFRITQEAITNITRHANTNRAHIRLHHTPQQISLEIEDYGCGFQTTSTPNFDHGCGIAGMRERAESVNGNMLIESHPGHGTKIEVVIPLNPTDNAVTSELL